MHRGSLLNQGNTVTQGCRYILVGLWIATHNTSLASALGSDFLTVTIPAFPLGVVFEVDEGDAQNSAAKACDEQQGSAFPAGIRSGECLRGAILSDEGDDFVFEAWDGQTFNDVMARLVDLNQPVLKRWCKGAD